MLDLSDPVATVGALARQLAEGDAPRDKWERYFRGTQGLRLATPKFAAAYDSRMASVGANYVQLVVQAFAERLEVTGFRRPGTDAADLALWETWQRNAMDEQSQLAHMEALIHGRCYVLVWADGDGRARITVESPHQMTVAHDAGTRTRVAALKMWREDGETGDAYATLYLPDAIYKFVSRTAPGTPATVWERREEPIPNPLLTVPVVALCNRARLLDFDGQSEVEPIASLQDVVNRLLVDVLVSAEYSSLPRRWATGLEVQTDPETGQPVEPFDPAGRLWQSESDVTRFGEFGEPKLDGLLGAIEQVVQHVASISGVPGHYLLSPSAKGGPSSAESIKATEASLIAKCKRKMLAFGAAWEEVMRLCIAVEEGSVPAGAESLETQWASAETRSEAQMADAALKRRDVGVPVVQLWRDMGYSEVEIARMQSDRAADAMNLDVVLRGVGRGAGNGS